ncbi:MAG: ABC transporter ATP-binding protein [Pseudomonadota bacterium]|nr:ABC transporter ATP-binding protein [Pseudomonadota bacterium]
MLTVFRSWIWPIWLKRPILILSIFVIPMTLVIGQVSIPFFTRALLNALNDKSNIQVQSIYLTLTWSLSKLIIRLQIFANAIPISNFIQDIRALILKSILNLNHPQSVLKSPSGWTQLTIDLSKSIEYVYGMIIWNILPTLGLFILILIEVYKIHPMFFWVYLCYITFQLNMMWYLRNPISEKSRLFNHEKNLLIENYTPLFKQNIALICPTQIRQMLKHFEVFSYNEIASRNGLIKTVNVVRLMMDIIAIGVFTLIILLMIKQHHQLLIGDLSFIIMTLISTIDKAWSLGQNWCDLQSALSLINNYQWLAHVSEKKDLINPKKQCFKTTNLIIENLSFSYDNKRFIIENLSTVIPNSRIIGIHGLPGSGKSTLMKLFYGSLEPQKGRIYFANQNFLDLKQHEKYQLICFIPQESTIYPNLNIIDNLRLAKPNITDNMINQALKLAQCHTWIYSTNRNTLGKHLSGGQKQQLCIARAFLDIRPIWILDEALSAVDENTHRFIMTNIINHSNISRIFIISHQKRDHIYCDVKVNLNEIKKTHYLVSSEK